MADTNPNTTEDAKLIACAQGFLEHLKNLDKNGETFDVVGSQRFLSTFNVLEKRANAAASTKKKKKGKKERKKKKTPKQSKRRPPPIVVETVTSPIVVETNTEKEAGAATTTTAAGGTEPSSSSKPLVSPTEESVASISEVFEDAILSDDEE